MSTSSAISTPISTPMNAHALIIGIADYPSIRPLPHTVLKDAGDIYDTLVNVNICAYPKGNVQLLLNEEATRTRLQGALADLATRSDPESMVFIYISSHGGRISLGADAGEYLLPVDTTLKPGSYPPELEPQSAISGEQFTEALRAIKSQKLVVVFDCCHSGGIGQPKEGVERVFKAGFPESYYQKLTSGRGRVILASSRDTEESWILPGAANSLFTQYLLAGLRGGVASDDGMVRILHLYEYVQPGVTVAQPNQHPILKAEIEENFPIALYLGGQKGIIPKDEQGFRYDAYISWTRSPNDMQWLRERILPKLRTADLRLAMSGQVEEPGVSLVVSVERSIDQAKRILILLSREYLASNWTTFENVMAQQLSIEQRKARLLPVVVDKSLLNADGHLNEDVPLRLRQLSALDLTDEWFGEENLARLPALLRGPIPGG